MNETTAATIMKKCLRFMALLGLSTCFAASLHAQDTVRDGYEVQPGDILEVSVWKEEDLQRQVLIRPDGYFSFPLVGDVDASGKTVGDLREEISARLERYIPDLVVTVTVSDIQGNKIYVLGQVNNP